MVGNDQSSCCYGEDYGTEQRLGKTPSPVGSVIGKEQQAVRGKMGWVVSMKGKKIKNFDCTYDQVYF